MKTKFLVGVLLLTVVAPWSEAQTKTKPTSQSKRAVPLDIPDVTTEIYKRVGNVELKLYIMNPKEHKPSDRRPAIVFFFGGGWRNGTPQQFYHHGMYLAQRGMVAIAVDYRVQSRHGVKVVDCIADAKDAIRWVRTNAKRLGIDPNRIVASGGSAGGHLAATTGTIADENSSNEKNTVSSRPNALVLFNPVVDLTPEGFFVKPESQRHRDLAERFGTTQIKTISPLHHIDSHTPPTIIFHGTADHTVPYAQVEHFAKLMKEAGRPCELVGFKGQGHGFFNHGRDDNKWFNETIRHTDRFLTSIGYLSPRPADTQPTRTNEPPSAVKQNTRP